MSTVIFWILIFRTTDRKYTITMTSVIVQALYQYPEDAPLLYLRVFNSMQDAVGHKLFLESLSSQTLIANIRSINPKMKNMRNIVQQFYSGNQSIK